MYAPHKPHLPNSGLTIYRGIPGEQFHGSKASIFKQRSLRQPRIGLLIVDLGGLDQAVDLCADGGAVDGIAEQPSSASDHKRLDRSFSGVVVDEQITRFDIALQSTPVIHQILPIALCGVTWDGVLSGQIFS